ncbi:MAG: hypothetical protein NZ898_01960 [Myxococcota bacterium]|nr:hypothetical protein [Myxococcota bacterium]MDW8361575.1 hypothetical protein [Myxococcales bacterium]
MRPAWEAAGGCVCDRHRAPRRARRGGCAPWILCVFVGSGCAPDLTTVELNFPSETAFLYASQARVLVRPLAAADVDRCPELLGDALAGSDVAASAQMGPASVCAFRDGRVTLDDAPDGPAAWLGLVDDGANRTILAGCAIADGGGGNRVVVIALVQTDRYRETSDVPPTCPTIEAKCGGACAP